MVESPKTWWLYVLRCSDGSLYCGIALDVMKRLVQHRKGRGSKFVRSHLPVTLLTSVGPFTNSDALKMEAEFKKKSKEDKEWLVFACSDCGRTFQRLENWCERLEFWYADFRKAKEHNRKSV